MRKFLVLSILFWVPPCNALAVVEVDWSMNRGCIISENRSNNGVIVSYAASCPAGSLKHTGWSGFALLPPDENGVAEVTAMPQAERSLWCGSMWGHRGRNASFNDNVRSIFVSPGCQAIVYEHNERGGRSTMFNSSVGDTGGWSGLISSAICRCGASVNSNIPAPGGAVSDINDVLYIVGPKFP